MEIAVSRSRFFIFVKICHVNGRFLLGQARCPRRDPVSAGSTRPRQSSVSRTAGVPVSAVPSAPFLPLRGEKGQKEHARKRTHGVGSDIPDIEHPHPREALERLNQEAPKGVCKDAAPGLPPRESMPDKIAERHEQQTLKRKAMRKS